MTATSSCLSLVACNVYVSAGRPRRANILKGLLAEAQERCRDLRLRSVAASPSAPPPTRDDDGGSSSSRRRRPLGGVVRNDVAVVHAYADGPYDRSSFHLAGSASSVADVATMLATSALTSLAGAGAGGGGETQVGGEGGSSRHPYVGLVDHVAVMPLFPPPPTTSGDDDGGRSASAGGGGSRIDDDEGGTFVPSTAHGKAARTIGHALSAAGVRVLYYGDADPFGTPLASVRRDRTSFFRSGGLSSNEEKQTAEDDGDDDEYGVATVGAPSTFVENYNVRLTSKCTRKLAASLARALRERDGGITGVEALTLPYGEGRYEVACNLLKPHLGGTAEEIERRLDTWIRKLMVEEGGVVSEGKAVAIAKGRDLYVEGAYRIGTTAEQCLRVLRLETSESGDLSYDEEVRERFEGYLSER